MTNQIHNILHSAVKAKAQLISNRTELTQNEYIYLVMFYRYLDNYSQSIIESLTQHIDSWIDSVAGSIIEWAYWTDEEGAPSPHTQDLPFGVYLDCAMSELLPPSEAKNFFNATPSLQYNGTKSLIKE